MTAVRSTGLPADTRRTSRLAANPISYWAAGRPGRQVPRRCWSRRSPTSPTIGFTAVKADVPEGMSGRGYAALDRRLRAGGVAQPVRSPFDETIDIGEEMERAKRFAADQVALGLDRTMVSSMAAARPAGRAGVGADFDKDRLALAVENCGIICQVLQSAGPAPAAPLPRRRRVRDRGRDRHPARHARSGPARLRPRHRPPHPGPGIDPAALIRRYADRIGGIHLKDCFPDHLDPAARRGLGYDEVAATKRLWAEPGLGVVDFDAVLAALPADYDGDFMIEVDEPSVDSRRLSHQMSFDWARRALPLSAP